jgi:hypothetical protein
MCYLADFVTAAEYTYVFEIIDERARVRTLDPLIKRKQFGLCIRDQV